MLGRKSELVYRRPKAGYEEFDPENWDDSAIAKAYDAAVKKIDKSSTNASPLSAGDGGAKMKYPDMIKAITPIRENNVEHSRDVSVPSKTNMKKHEENDEAVTNWKLGDTCVAIYHEDGLYYHCKIKSMNKNGTCVVEYQGYGNEETLKIADLHRAEEWERYEESENLLQNSSTRSSSSRTRSSSITCTSSTQSTDETSSDITQDIYRENGVKKKHHKQKSSKKTNNDYPFPPPFPNLAFNPYLMMPPPPFIGGPFPFHVDKETANSQVTQLPDVTDDALSSMLMSWYMAGYHTGYYQGLSEKRNENPKRTKKKSKH